MKDLYLHIDSHADESIEQLFELVRQPSISAQKLGFDKAPGVMTVSYTHLTLPTILLV